jgi:hypothetical protein
MNESSLKYGEIRENNFEDKETLLAELDTATT